jgi:putative membrane protein
MIRKLGVLIVAVAAAACATAPQQISAGGIDLPDEEIAAVLRAANQGEVDQGQMAGTRATNAEVRAFAEMMVRDHTNALQEGSQVFARANVIPQDNATSSQLQTSSANTVRALSTYSGADFDRHYMRTQVELHDWLLRTIDTSLIPSARSQELVRFLRDQRAAVAMHLEHARRLQQGLR